MSDRVGWKNFKISSDYYEAFARLLSCYIYYISMPLMYYVYIIVVYMYIVYSGSFYY